VLSVVPPNFPYAKKHMALVLLTQAYDIGYYYFPDTAQKAVSCFS